MRLSDSVGSVINGLVHDSDDSFEGYRSEIARTGFYKANRIGLSYSPDDKRDVAAVNIAFTVLKAYYRLMCLRSENFGGEVIVGNKRILEWLSCFISAFLDVRGVQHANCMLADFLAMDGKVKNIMGSTLIIKGVPTNPGSPTSSWELIKLVQSVSPQEVILLTHIDPADWGLTKTSTNKAFRVEDHFSVCNLYQWRRDHDRQ